MLLYRAPSPHHSTTHTHSNPLLFLLSIHLIIPSSQSLSSPKPAMKSYTYQPNLKKYDGISIKSLHRYAVKGLSGDSVSSMTLIGGDGTFEDDRRFALLYDEKTGVFDEDNPKWLHKVRRMHHNVLAYCVVSRRLDTRRTNLLTFPSGYMFAIAHYIFLILCIRIISCVHSQRQNCSLLWILNTEYNEMTAKIQNGY